MEDQVRSPFLTSVKLWAISLGDFEVFNNGDKIQFSKVFLRDFPRSGEVLPTSRDDTTDLH